MQRGADPEASIQELTDLDIQFHECIVRAARHRRLLETWLTLREQFRIALLSRNAANRDYQELLYADHYAVLEALRSGDTARMLERTALHIHKAYVRLLRTYDGRIAGDGSSNRG
jgi:DNA-binding GntR family transcriptional regulator